MSELPDQLPTSVGQPNLQAQRIINAVEEVYAEAPPTRYRDDRSLPAIGTAPPVAQPGVPPMSQRATDISRILIASGVACIPPGLIAIGVLVASEHADPTVIGMICAAPAAIAVPILAIARLLRRAGETAPADHHHHYTGPVRQHHQHVHNQSRLWGKSTTNL